MTRKRKKRNTGRRKRRNDVYETVSPLQVIRDSLYYHKSLYIVLGIIITVVIAVGIAVKYIADNYTVTNIYVNGNTHYTNEEIIDMVMKGRFGNNSLYLSLKYRDKSIEDIPFVQKMDVDIISPDTIRINVYEKAIAGYISYLNRYMYFDRDGIVVESSSEPSDTVPLVLRSFLWKMKRCSRKYWI